MSDFRVVVCGGGVAAVEGLLHLRRLAGKSVQVALIAPNEELFYRPMAVREPFAFGPTRRYPLRIIARDNDVEWMKDSLAWVEPDARVVHTRQGECVQFDALLIAVGGRSVETYKAEHVTTFRDGEADATYQGIVQDIEQGYTQSVAFIQPVGPVWPLPIYELALMTAERARSMDVRGFGATLVTPEREPLAVFGSAVSEVVSDRMKSAGIEVFSNALAKVPESRRLVVEPVGVELHPQRIVAMPRVGGPSVKGLAGGGASGFIPIDRHCSVPGTKGRIFAAGDAANYPIKHGGLGTEMADVAAAAIAKLAGAVESAPPFNPVIRGRLLTGSDPLYISARPVGSDSFASEVFASPPWWPPDDKVIASELGRYLAGLEGSPELARRP
jgi:sulfide:quinone oxidoreductase